jgi:stage II sporulation protein D
VSLEETILSEHTHRQAGWPAALTALALALACALAPAIAEAKGRWVIKGAGFGHGIGMSQYGAFGFAKKGATYRAILKHYYSGTEIGDAGA